MRAPRIFRATSVLPLVIGLLMTWCTPTFAQLARDDRVLDLPTRPNVTQRLLVLSPAVPRAAVVLFAGGHGGLQLSSEGKLGWGAGNFLIRMREEFVRLGLLVVLIDAPSDRQSPPFLAGFRQTPEHVADVKAVIAWVRSQTAIPVWLVGTSRGTQSVAYLGTQMTGADGPDGLVLTASVLSDPRGRPVPDMPLTLLRAPVLVVHHEQDACPLCRFGQIDKLMGQLNGTRRHKLLSFTGGNSQGDPCEAHSYHGFSGIEPDVVAQIAAWILEK